MLQRLLHQQAIARYNAALCNMPWADSRIPPRPPFGDR